MAMNAARRFVGRFNLLLAGVLGIAAWAVLAALATRPDFKRLFDVTPQARFTVSEATTALLGELRSGDKRVRIDTFFAPLRAGRTPEEQALFRIPAQVEQLLRDLLARYAELGGAAIEVVHYDPNRDIEASRARIAELGQIRAGGSFVVVSIGDRKRVLELPGEIATIDNPAADPNPGPGASRALPRLASFEGEEAISTAIRSLLVEGEPRIYLLTRDRDTLSLTAARAGSYSELLRALDGEGFDLAVHAIESDPRIPEDADVLALLEPTWQLSERAAEAITGFVVGGGRLFVNTSWQNVDSRNLNPPFARLGERFGFTIGDDLVCCLVPDPAMPGAPGVGGQRATLLTIEAMAPQHPITRPLVEVQRLPQLATARPIEPRPDAPDDVRFVPLLQTGAYSWLAPRDGQQGALLTPPATREAFQPRIVGATIEVDGGGARPGQIVLISGLAFYNRMLGINGDLALNTFNWLVRRSELVTVRGNRYEAREVELTPQQLDRATALLQSWVPGLLLAVGLAVLAWRRFR